MSDTIAAIATGGEKSAIGIVRVSGEGAIAAAEAVFRPSRGKKLGDLEPGRLYYGEILDRGGETVDLGLCAFSRAPKSYTGEDTAELHCHGSPVVMAETLAALFKAGARQAEAGEFTKRAFLNGKLDLTEAEAVADLIDSRSPAAAANAAGQLTGAIRSRADAVYERLLAVASHFEAAVDFPEEGVEPFLPEEYREAIGFAGAELSRLAATYDRGRFLKTGVPTAIVGRPNVGKSSLFNALLGYDRAIVTPIAGTTRDTIEESVTLGDLTLRISDTAGLRDTPDAVEAQGVLRAERAAEAAELVIGVFDGSEELKQEDGRTLRALERAKFSLAVINKSDLPQRLAGVEGIRLSARTCDGLEEFIERLKSMFAGEKSPRGGLITNPRQYGAVKRAADSLDSARRALDAGLTPDAVLTDIEEAMDALASLTGRSVKEDVVAGIFSRFCVGK